MIGVTIGVGEDFHEFAKWSAAKVEKHLGIKTYILDEHILKYANSPGWETDMGQKASCLKFLLFKIFPNADRIMYFDADWRPVRDFNIYDYVPDENALYFCKDEGGDELGERYGLGKGRYFNAGWFVASRKHAHLFEECHNRFNEFETVWFDQCIMNQVFNDKVTYADPRLNKKISMRKLKEGEGGDWATYDSLVNDWVEYAGVERKDMLTLHHGVNFQVFKNEIPEFTWHSEEKN